MCRVERNSRNGSRVIEVAASHMTVVIVAQVTTAPWGEAVTAVSKLVPDVSGGTYRQATNEDDRDDCTSPYILVEYRPSFVLLRQRTENAFM
jgi:hypothetical protein